MAADEQHSALENHAARIIIMIMKLSLGQRQVVMVSSCDGFAA